MIFGRASNILVLFVLGINFGHAQITFDRWVISAFSLTGNTGSEVIEVCGGQPEYTLIGSSDFLLSQGFIQPNKGGLIYCEVKVDYDPCSKLYSVFVDSIFGCTSGQEVLITWNGSEGGRNLSTPDSIVRLSVSTGLSCTYLKYLNLRVLAANDAQCELSFYNFITPNQDGLNDYWVIEKIEEEKFRKNSVVISNRWGQRVWNTEGYNNTDNFFNGVDQQGNVLPDGTYYYVVTTEGQTFKGFIEITR
jgi:gliding motility-associated-like protein